MLRANYHTHTTFCDGDNTAQEMVNRALELGFLHLGFSGHMDEEINMDWPAYVAEVSRLRTAYADRLDILCGVELDTLYDPACCPGVEYVIGSTHYVDVDVPFSRAIDSSAELSQRLCDTWRQGGGRCGGAAGAGGRDDGHAGALSRRAAWFGRLFQGVQSPSPATR